MNREPYDLGRPCSRTNCRRSPAAARRVGNWASSSIARIVAEGQEIYSRKLIFADAARRIDTVHRPYHAGAGGPDRRGKGRPVGAAILIDWHSMPSAAAQTSDEWRFRRRGRLHDLVLGDRFELGLRA